MTGNELERLTKALQSDPKMIKAIKRLDRGVGTYKDVNSMAIFIGRRIAEEMGISFSAEALTNYLEAGHQLVVMSAQSAQTNLNRAAGNNLKPKTTKTPNAKISKAVGAVAVAEPETVGAVCENIVPTLMLEMVDDIVKYNADFQKDAAARSNISRMQMRKARSRLYPNTKSHAMVLLEQERKLSKEESKMRQGGRNWTANTADDGIIGGQ